MHKENIHISWGIRADKLKIKEITDTLDFQPSHAFERGEEYLTRSGLYQRYSGVWRFSTENIVNSDNLDDHIQFILNKLEKKKDFILQLVNDPEYYIDFRVWYETKATLCSFGIDSRLISRISPLCNDFNFSCIAWDEE